MTSIHDKTIKMDCVRCDTKGVQFLVKKEASTFQFDRTRNARMVLTDVFAVCGVCERGSLFEYRNQVYPKKRPDEGSKFTGVSHPKPRELKAPKGTPINAARYYVQGLYNVAKNPDAAGSMFRKALEVGLKEKINKESGNLYSTIEEMQKKHLITKDMAEWSHRIRSLGNRAVHDHEPWKVSEAEEICRFTELLFQYLFTLPSMLASAKSSFDGKAK